VHADLAQRLAIARIRALQLGLDRIDVDPGR